MVFLLIITVFLVIIIIIIIDNRTLASLELLSVFTCQHYGIGINQSRTVRLTIEILSLADSRFLCFSLLQSSLGRTHRRGIDEMRGRRSAFQRVQRIRL